LHLVLLEDHAGGLRRFAGGVADVEALDAQLRRVGDVQVQRFDQRARALLLRAFFGQQPGQRESAPLAAISSQMRRCSRGWCCARTRTWAASPRASSSAGSTAWLVTSCGGTTWPM
jgi:hypothetical protein